MTKAIKPIGEEFRRRFREARDQIGLSQRDIAEKTGMSQEWIAMIEIGKRRVFLDDAGMLAADVAELRSLERKLEVAHERTVELEQRIAETRKRIEQTRG